MEEETKEAELDASDEEASDDALEAGVSERDEEKEAGLFPQALSERKIIGDKAIIRRPRFI
jgi:hypothetical protein